MGIGNTTSASAICAAITGSPVADVTGLGAGINQQQLLRKAATIRRALEANQPDGNDAIDVLSKVGGFEIGGLAGVMLTAAANRIPVVIDGFISGAAALIAVKLAPPLPGVSCSLSPFSGAGALYNSGLHRPEAFAQSGYEAG